MFVKSLGAAAGALLLSSAASVACAATVDITSAVGNLDAVGPSGYTSSSFAYGSGQSFSDTFLFTLGSSAHVYLDVATVTSALKGLQFSGVQLTQGASVLPPVSGGLPSFDFGNLQAGQYTLTLSGLASGVAGGSYHIDLMAQPVPEPETVALMLAGLGVMGAVARRRRAH